MCGLVGVLGPNASSRAQQMLPGISHRGPDGSGVWSGAGVALGHTRLAIIDPTPASDQPFHKGDLVITYNGEIYNHIELRHELERCGARFDSSGDTEVVAEVLNRWGTPGLARLRGMFAIAVWDRRDQSLSLVRDQQGIKPLYWHQLNGGIEWASEVRTLAASASALPKGIAVHEYLRFGAPITAPIVDGVNEVVPGTVLRFDSRGVSLRHFTEPVSRPRIARGFDGRGDLRPDPATALATAIGRHARADRPVAVFLSGGFDSALLVKGLRDAGSAPLGITLATSTNAEDVERAKATAVHYGIDHEIVELRDRCVVDEVREFWGGLDQPTIDGFNTHLISRAAIARGFPVALSGLGADEILGGYRYYRLEPALRRIRPIVALTPKAVKRAAASRIADVAGKPAARIEALLLADGAARVHMAFRTLFDTEEVAELAFTRPPGSIRWDTDPTAHPWHALAQLDAATYLRPTLLRDADVHSMRHGVELRVPFLDVDLVASSTGSGRRPTKSSLADAIGDRYLAEKAREPKLTFRLPWTRWMPEIVAGHRGLIEAPEPWRGLLDASKARTVLADDRRGRGEPLRKWALLTLAAWLDRRITAHGENAVFVPAGSQDAAATQPELR